MAKIKVASDTALIRLDEKVMSTSVDGETVIMNVDTGRYFALNEVSTDIWALLENQTCIDDIVAELMKSYEIDFKTCHAHTSEAIFHMLQANIIHVV